MGKFKKKNIAMGALWHVFLPEGLWNHRFVWAWIGSLATVIAFDLLWCSQTSWRGMFYVSTYLSALAMATLMALPTVFTQKNWVQMAVMALVDVLCIANLMYCRSYFGTIPIGSYGLAGQLMTAPATIWDSFSWIYLVFPLILLLTFIVMIPDRDEQLPRKTPYLLTLGTLCLICGVTAYFHGGMVSHIEQLRSHGRNVYVPPVAYGLIGNLIADGTAKTDEITDRQRQSVAAWGKDHLRYQAQMTAVGMDSVPRRRNLVVILCESLESWPLGKSIEVHEITPNLNSPLNDSTTWYAPKVLSQAGNGREVDGELLMLAGMHPTRNDAWTTRYASDNLFTLPKAMKEQNATTYLLTGSSQGLWNRGTMADSFGIDHLLTDSSWDDTEKIGTRISDGALMQQAVAKMRRGEVWKPGETAFVQINTSSAHQPFDIPTQMQAISLKENYPSRLKNYITAVNYTDQALGTLLSYLQSRPDHANTMIVIAGNHEALTSWRQQLRSTTQGQKLIDGAGYVPLIIANAPFPGRRDAVMGQVDVYTTLLDQMGLPYRWRGMGFSALSEGAPEFAVTHQGTPEGRNTAINPGLTEHVDRAREVSDIILRFNLMNEQ